MILDYFFKKHILTISATKFAEIVVGESYLVASQFCKKNRISKRVYDGFSLDLYFKDDEAKTLFIMKYDL